MKEVIDIVDAYDLACREGKKAALATVVMVEGSAYRRAGARMLITEDGKLTGAISGGCLEGDALRKARMVILQQEALLVTYDTMDDEDAEFGVGLGCKGIIHILIEPLNELPNNPIQFLKIAIAARNYAALVTLFFLEDRKAPQPGTCLCLTNTATLVNRIEALPYKHKLLDDAKAVLENKSSLVVNYNGYTAFVECLKPLMSLIILGAGNDAMPLTKIAAVLGWHITIIDGRPNYASIDRFPFTNKIIVAKPQQVLADLEINEWTAFVLMTHNYNYEIAFLRELLPLKVSYIGILGPKKKLELILGELEDKAVCINKETLDAIYGPIGLDIGSENAEEIALSIAAEIKAVFSKRNGHFLKYKVSLIHSL